MPTIDRILETSLYVADLDRSEAFYRDVFEFRTMLADDRLRALSVGEQQVLLLFLRGKSNAGAASPGGHIPGHDASGRQHLAFRIEPEALDAWQERLVTLGIAIESRVRFNDQGQSLYLRDPDDHAIELATPHIWPFR